MGVRLIYYSKGKVVKVEVNEVEQQISYGFIYPCLLKSVDTELVLFCVDSADDPLVLVSDDDWSEGDRYEGFEEKDFRLFRGSVTLSNQSN